jgi:hypothetical protein
MDVVGHDDISADGNLPLRKTASGKIQESRVHFMICRDGARNLVQMVMK